MSVTLKLVDVVLNFDKIERCSRTVHIWNKVQIFFFDQPIKTCVGSKSLKLGSSDCRRSVASLSIGLEVFSVRHWTTVKILSLCVGCSHEYQKYKKQEILHVWQFLDLLTMILLVVHSGRFSFFTLASDWLANK